MTPEQQRVAIAEACGWKFLHHTPRDGWHRLIKPDGTCSIEGENPFRFIKNLPNYPGCLNACAEMAAHLRKTDRLAYLTYHNWIDRLVARRNSQPENDGSGCIATEDAPADVRTESFLRAIGRWEGA